MQFRRLKGNWGEISVLLVVNILLTVTNLFAYQLSTKGPALYLFFVFLIIVIYHSYKSKFEGLGLDLTKKGSTFLFLKTCMPYMLQTVFYAQCSLIIGWILSNLDKWQNTVRL